MSLEHSHMRGGPLAHIGPAAAQQRHITFSPQSVIPAGSIPAFIILLLQIFL